MPSLVDLALRFKGFRALLAVLLAANVKQPSDADLDEIVAVVGAGRFLDALDRATAPPR